MAHQFGNIIAYNTYFLPESSNWVGELGRDPCLAFASSLALTRAGAFEILVFGDLNARTGSQTLSVHDPFRVSKDDKPPVPLAEIFYFDSVLTGVRQRCCMLRMGRKKGSQSVKILN
jgi:hypothetical protein